MIRNVGGLSITKGRIKGVPTAMWDAVPICDPCCRIFLNCPHNPYDPEDLLLLVQDEPETYEQFCREQCSLRKRYLNSVFKALQSTQPPDKTSEMSQHTIGFFLVPLYSHLITFKIMEYSMKGNVLTGRGGVSPIYREMRDTMRTIHSLLKEIGVSAKESEGYLNGDGDYYDSLIEDGDVIS